MGDFDSLVRSNVDIFAWAYRVIQFVCGSTTITIIITSCYRGSIVIEYILESESVEVLDDALSNINSTETVNVDNFTFPVISNTILSLDDDIITTMDGNAVNVEDSNDAMIGIVVGIILASLFIIIFAFRMFMNYIK